MFGMEVIVEVPVNIALIKYWGKRHEELVLPLNDSISVNIDALTATTTVRVGTDVPADRVEINGREVASGAGTRFFRVFTEVRKRNRLSQMAAAAADGNSETKSAKRNGKTEDGGEKDWHVDVRSTTNFPVAAGLASSAAGFAAIACGLGHALRLSDAEIVRLARLGSGSACRSVKDGFVHWRAVAAVPDRETANDKPIDVSAVKEEEDGGCESLAGADHWPALRAVIVVLDERAKAVGSSVGMRTTVATSTLLRSRVADAVPQRVEALKAAIAARDFACLADITMAESNQLHAVCLDTFPPLSYLNDDSRRLIDFVHTFNRHCGATRLAYTFDAGPNCCLLMEAEWMDVVLASLGRCFRFDPAVVRPLATVQQKDGNNSNEGGKSESGDAVPSKVRRVEDKSKSVDAKKSRDAPADVVALEWTDRPTLAVRAIVCSTVGMGPRYRSLVNAADGLPAVADGAGPTALVGSQITCKML